MRASTARARLSGAATLVAALLSVACEGPTALHPEDGPASVKSSGSQAELLKSLRQATARFHSTAQALRAGYQPDAHCVAAPGLGGMGFHWANPPLTDAVFAPSQPEVLLFAPDLNGNLKLVAVEYVVINTGQAHPSFGGHPFDVGGVPPLQQAGIPHWSLHVWLWEDNPNGIFAPFNPNISCPPEVVNPIIESTISAGEGHSCGIATSGAAYCWGDNSAGQLGISTIPPPDRLLAPQNPVAGGLAFAQISAGGGHSCGISTAGAAYCWGSNRSGQLGDGTTTNRRTPVAVAGGLTFRQIDAGSHYTVAITSTGVAYAWGNNDRGQLGDGTTSVSRASPTAVAGGLTFVQVSAGSQHTVAITPTGAAYAWGWNADGQLGDGTTDQRASPTAVVGGLTFRQVSAGSQHTMAFTTSGAAYGWGSNFGGQLGDGTTTSRTSPTAVVGGLTFKQITAGHNHSCGITIPGAAHCWGMNGLGQLGNGTTSSSTGPMAVAGGLTFRQISAGGAHTLALTPAGAAYAWGNNSSGQLGDGTTTNRTIPVAVLTGVTFQ